MKNRIIAVVSIILIVFCFNLYLRSKSDLVENEKMLDMRMDSLLFQATDMQEDTPYKVTTIEQKLSHAALFIWDDAYIFAPGTTRAEIVEIIGFKDKNIPRVVSDTKTQILFVQTSGAPSVSWVVCSIHGNKEYQFYMEEGTRYIHANKGEGLYLKGTLQEDKMVFKIVETGDYITSELSRFSDRSADEIEENQLELIRVIPYIWQDAYFFTPHTTREEMVDIIGFDDVKIPDNEDSQMTTAIFVSDDTILHTIYGEKPYDFYFEDMDKYKRLSRNDDPVFYISKKNSDYLLLVYLDQQE